MDDTPEFDDERLTRVLLVAALQVNNSVDFENDYTIDIQTSTLSPDPTLAETKEDAFLNLMTIKAACIMERGQAIKTASQAISAREFSTSINLTGVAKAKLDLLLKGGWCAVYEQEVLDHQMSGIGTAGAAILGPFRTMAGYDGPGIY